MSSSSTLSRRMSRRLHVAITLLLPGPDLGFGFFLGDAVSGLDLADELVAPAFDLEQIVFGELAPLLLHGAFGLVPAALELLPDRLGVGLAGLPGGLRMNDGRQRADGERRTSGENGD